MTYSYAISGSEDGLIAIATSPGKAVAIAKAYVEQCGGTAKWNGTHDMGRAIAQLRQREENYLSIDNIPVGSTACSNAASADIEKVSPNWYGGRDW